MASVSLTCWESTLSPTLSLCDSGNLFYPFARQRRPPNTISFYDHRCALFFLATPVAARPAPGRGDRACRVGAGELGGRWQQHPPSDKCRYCSRRLSRSAIPEIYFIRSRASAARRIRANKATDNKSPVPNFVREESYSKGRLRVSNGLCKDSCLIAKEKCSASR